MTGNSPTSRSVFIAILIGIAALALLTDLTNLIGRKKIMTVPTPSIQTLFAETKVVCVGRYLIDVPRTAEIVYGPAIVYSSIERFPGKASVMDEVVSHRLMEIVDEKDYANRALQGRDSMVGKVMDGGVPGQKIVFGVSKTSGSMYNVHSYFTIGEDLFVQETQAFAGKEKYTESVRGLNEIAANTRSRVDDDPPSVSGVCIDGAITVDVGHAIPEAVTVGIRIKEIPDVHFSIAMTKKDVLVESDALEPRLAQAESDAKKEGEGSWFSRVKVLRKGARQLSVWQGYELLARKPVQKAQGESHEFLFISQGEPKNAYLPVLDIRLDTGVDGNRLGGRLPGLADDEALELWERLTNSIRIRPSGAGASTTAQTAAEHSDVLAGTICPHTGWWYCNPSDGASDVEGGRIQYFRSGERMPQAVVLDSRSLWQRVRGVKPRSSSSAPTEWRLSKSASFPNAEGPNALLGALVHQNSKE